MLGKMDCLEITENLLFKIGGFRGVLKNWVTVLIVLRSEFTFGYFNNVLRHFDYAKAYSRADL